MMACSRRWKVGRYRGPLLRPQRGLPNRTAKSVFGRLRVVGRYTPCSLRKGHLGIIVANESGLRRMQVCVEKRDLTKIISVAVDKLHSTEAQVTELLLRISADAKLA